MSVAFVTQGHLPLCMSVIVLLVEICQLPSNHSCYRPSLRPFATEINTIDILSGGSGTPPKNRWEFLADNVDSEFDSVTVLNLAVLAKFSNSFSCIESLKIHRLIWRLTSLADYFESDWQWKNWLKYCYHKTKRILENSERYLSHTNTFMAQTFMIDSETNRVLKLSSISYFRNLSFIIISN